GSVHASTATTRQYTRQHQEKGYRATFHVATPRQAHTSSLRSNPTRAANTVRLTSDHDAEGQTRGGPRGDRRERWAFRSTRTERGRDVRAGAGAGRFAADTTKPATDDGPIHVS